jgi:hypothetical protein
MFGQSSGTLKRMLARQAPETIGPEAVNSWQKPKILIVYATHLYSLLGMSDYRSGKPGHWFRSPMVQSRAVIEETYGEDSLSGR